MQNNSKKSRAHSILTIFMAILLLIACTDKSGSVDQKLPLKIQTTPVQPAQTEQTNRTALNQRRVITLSNASRPYITVASISPQTFIATVQAPSRVEFRAKALSTVGAVVSGRLSKIDVQVGDPVKAGAPLATLESTEAAQMRSDVSRTKDELLRAEDHARRQEAMLKSGVGLEIERNEANIMLREALTDYERSVQATQLLGSGTDQSVVLRAPINGVVLRVNASIGTAVEAGAVLFELGEPGALWVVADVFENDLPLIEKGAKVELQITTLSKPVKGHVAAVSAAMQADLRRGAVYIELDNTNLQLKPGMFARAMIEVAGPKRIVLPTSAILIKDKNQTIVYIEVSDGEFEPRNVLIGQAHDGFVPVLEGLNAGERVVTSGTLLLDSEASMLL
ncbi:MAG: efflux RND transporter periplasmic adaptor subunit [Methylococcaceae bacterium]